MNDSLNIAALWFFGAILWCIAVAFWASAKHPFIAILNAMCAVNFAAMGALYLMKA